MGYQDSQSGQRFILMINQAICIKSLENHMLCPMQCCVNGVHISEVHKFLVEHSSKTTNAIELTEVFYSAHLLTIPHKLTSVTSYSAVYSTSIAEYENEDIPKIHLTAKEPPWDPSTNEYSERFNDRSDQYPCNNSKGTSIFQCICLIITSLQYQ